MVRFATEADRPAILDVLKSAEAGAACYSFADADGHCLVSETDGVIQGVALLAVNRPYLTIRELAIRPESRRRLVLAQLSAAIFAVAKVHGAQGVEGFKAASDPDAIAFSRDRGAIVHEGARVRWLLTDPGVVELLDRQERNAPK